MIQVPDYQKILWAVNRLKDIEREAIGWSFKSIKAKLRLRKIKSFDSVKFSFYAIEAYDNLH